MGIFKKLGFSKERKITNPVQPTVGLTGFVGPVAAGSLQGPAPAPTHNSVTRSPSFIPPVPGIQGPTGTLGSATGPNSAVPGLRESQVSTPAHVTNSTVSGIQGPTGMQGPMALHEQNTVSSIKPASEPHSYALDSVSGNGASAIIGGNTSPASTTGIKINDGVYHQPAAQVITGSSGINNVSPAVANADFRAGERGDPTGLTANQIHASASFRAGERGDPAPVITPATGAPTPTGDLNYSLNSVNGQYTPQKPTVSAGTTGEGASTTLVDLSKSPTTYSADDKQSNGYVNTMTAPATTPSVSTSGGTTVTPVDLSKPPTTYSADDKQANGYPIHPTITPPTPSGNTGGTPQQLAGSTGGSASALEAPAQTNPVTYTQDESKGGLKNSLVLPGNTDPTTVINTNIWGDPGIKTNPRSIDSVSRGN